MCSVLPSFLNSNITPSQRRTQRRRRAHARLDLYLFKLRYKVLSTSRLISIRHILGSHHSQDPRLQSRVTKLIKDTKMASWKKQESWPWTCRFCGVDNSKIASYCQGCGAWWEQAYVKEKKPRGPSQPKDKNKNKWDWPKQAGAPPGEGKRPNSRKPAKKPKEPKQDGEKEWPSLTPSSSALSPFGHVAAASSLASPWTAQDPNVFTALSPSPSTTSTAVSTVMQNNSELIKALKDAYQGKEDTMPEHVRSMLDTGEQEQGKLLTKQLHSATSALGKARKNLTEIMESKRVHRLAWTKHLTESLAMWEQQLQDYRQQQAAYQEKATAASEEVSKAKKTIHCLNSGAKPEDMPAEEDDVPDAVGPDQEEENLRNKLTMTYKAFAGSLGVDVAQAQAIPVDDDDEDLNSGTEGAPVNKRPCTAEARK